MKKLLLLTLISFFSFIKILKANETEPNNTSQQANVLALNGKDTGTIIKQDKDWWKITVNASGKLRVSFTSLSKAELRASMFGADTTVKISYGDSKNNHYIILLAGVTPGIYYIRITQLDSSAGDYKLSDTLVEMTLPPGDAEPDNYAAQALTLPVNSKVSGLLGYNVNGFNDDMDWYKITIPTNCTLRLKVTSSNKGYFYTIFVADTNFQGNAVYLYNANNTTKTDITGLAPGTYYIQMSYYAGFGSYTLSDSMITDGILQDDEPNNYFSQAKALPINGSKSGNVGFSNLGNNIDNGDFYKIVIPSDGNIHFKFDTSQVSGGYPYITADIFNADSSYLHSIDTYYSSNVLAGTYYIVIAGNNAHGVYTLEDSFYALNTDSIEPNNRPYQAKTIPDYINALGHLNNNINGGRDSVDWWKINNTSDGTDYQSNISFYVPQNTDSTVDVCFDLYGDTSGTVIHHAEIKPGTDNTAYFDLHSLTYGYYWIKVYPKKNTVFSTYSIQPSYIQDALVNYNVYYKDTDAECHGNNTIVYKPIVKEPNYNGPVIYQLYRYNIPYGVPDTIAQTELATFNNLPQGYYTVNAVVDGANGATSPGAGDIRAPFENHHIVLEPIPDSLKTQFITSTKARLSWDPVDCATYYIVHYKKQGDDAWITKKVAGDKTYWRLDSLAENTTYKWKVATEHVTNGIEAEGFFPGVETFTTSSTGLIADANELRISNNLNHNSIIISPNPAKSYFILSYNSNTLKKVNAILYDVNGKAVWSSGLVSANTLNNKKVFTSQFANGVYYFKLMDEQGADISKAMITIAK